MQAKPWLPLNVYLKAGAVMFPAKGQMADILGSVCNKVSIATAQICHHCLKAVTDNIKRN